MNLKTPLTAAALLESLPLKAGDAAPSHATFTSGGKAIGVDAFRPAKAENRASLLLLHGAAGLAGSHDFIRQIAAAFGALGLDAYVVHYFDRTGDTWVSDTAIRDKFELWISTLSDAISYVTGQPGVHSARIATFGFSLGGYLAIAHAARDPRVRALVELAGGIDPTYAAQTKRMPPTLILHGEDDQRVPVERAKEVEALLRELGTPHETKLYANEGHVLSLASAADALLRGMAFLTEHLP